MIYEYRVYTVLPGRMRDLHQRFEKVVFPVMQKHGMKTVGAWNPLIGDRSDHFIYMLGYEDLAARQKTWTEFHSDPDWKQEVQRGGSMISHEENMIFVPTTFSPLK